MQHVLAVFAACLLYAGSTIAEVPLCRFDWTTAPSSTKPGVILETGIEGLKVDQPAPELMQKIGPLLCAGGSEELRVTSIAEGPEHADPARQAERTVRLAQFIRGYPVRWGTVRISLNTETNEVTELSANFLPDCGLDQAPGLRATEARDKVEERMRKDSYVRARSGERARISFDEGAPAYLAYHIDPLGNGRWRGPLVWVFSARDLDDDEPYLAMVSASTGEVVALEGALGMSGSFGAE